VPVDENLFCTEPVSGERYTAHYDEAWTQPEGTKGTFRINSGKPRGDDTPDYQKRKNQQERED
jgi:hypothetical protein